MRKNNETRGLAQHLADEEIAFTIHYLAPNPGGKGSNDEASTFLVVCVCLMVLAAGAVAYFSLYLQMS